MDDRAGAANPPPRSFDALKTMLLDSRDTLPPRLIQVAAFALENPDEMALGTAASIAAQAAVQPSTLIRFAKRLGYSGFSDLQHVFRAEMRSNWPDYRERLARVQQARRTGGPHPLLSGFAESAMVSLERLVSQASEEDIGRAAEILARADVIYLLGMRRAFPVALYLAYAFGKYASREGTIDTAGNNPADSWEMKRLGARIDGELSSRDRLTVQGDIYSGNSELTVNIPGVAPDFFPIDTRLSGGNFLSRWQRELNDGGELSLQAYYDHFERKDVSVGEKRDTWDLDFSHSFSLFGNQELVWGAGFRQTRDSTQTGGSIALDPPNSRQDLYSLFIQDDIDFMGGSLHLILGSKFEHNDYTGFEIQPTARLLWTPTPRHSFWAAISRAVRTPSRIDRDIFGKLSDSTGVTEVAPGVIVPLRTIVSLTGNKAFKSEELLAYEVGYRAHPSERITFDLAAFYNVYHRLRFGDAGTPAVDSGPEGVTVTIPLKFGNSMTGKSFGLEAFSTVRMTEWWRFFAGYTWLKMNLDAPVTVPEQSEGPQHQFSLRSYVNLPHNFEFDSVLYYVAQIHDLDVPANLRLDLRLGWRPLKALEVSLKVENALHDRHREFSNNIGVYAEQIPRSIFGEVKLRF